MGRTGSALLPLHGGFVPRWLSDRMARLGRVITEAVVHEYGRDEYLRRLAHPHWFQSFGAVMGMDWHSSGITTSVLSALKRGLAPVSAELGIHVCGGRGNASRRTPDELAAVGERTGLDGDALARSSRLVAKVDSAAVQDGFDLYLHGFIVTDDGRWTVVQQGMSGARKQARRYHWLSEGLSSFVDAPHFAIDGEPRATPILNMTDVRAAPTREAQLVMLHDGPDAIVREAAKILFADRAPSSSQLLPLPHLDLPDRHDVRREDVQMKRLGGALAAAAERAEGGYEDVLLTPGVGARTIFSLAMVAEVVHGTPSRFSDPARFSLAHGGKDGHPYPVPLKVYDETIRVLRTAVDAAKLGNDDKLFAMKQLDEEARRLEAHVTDVDFEGFIEEEHRLSKERGGRTVLDDRADRAAAKVATTSRPRRSNARAAKTPSSAETGQLSLRLRRPS
jgi:uncharacterized protein